MKFGVLGGSGIYDLEGLTNQKSQLIPTPFGDPSDPVITGEIGGCQVAFIPRHGKGHRLLPSEINFRANVWALKSLGVTHLISVSAVGSLKEEIEPGHIVIPDQFIDRTKDRPSTFFGEGVVAHPQFGKPVCGELSGAIYEAAQKLNITTHMGGTYICMEGPIFSTQAESYMYRDLGASIIGMTNLQEAKLAREAEMCFATIALSTDYDCWHEEEVTLEAVLAVMGKNVANAKAILVEVLNTFKAKTDPVCSDQSSLAFAIMTDPAVIPVKTKQKLDLIIGKHIIK